MTASSDGQFFLASRQGEAMNLINAKYGKTRDLFVRQRNAIINALRDHLMEYRVSAT